MKTVEMIGDILGEGQSNDFGVRGVQAASVVPAGVDAIWVARRILAGVS